MNDSQLTIEFDKKLAEECARAFSNSVGVGCAVTDTAGNLIYQIGHGYPACDVCQILGKSSSLCRDAHIYGAQEAQRFGGKYVYYCPLGLSFFVSPIVYQLDCIAKVTAGPFLMVARDDYLIHDLIAKQRIDESIVNDVMLSVNKVPYLPARKVTDLSILLFMAVSSINNVFSMHKMLEIQGSNQIQGQINAYIEMIKHEEEAKYPFATEHAFVQSIKDAEKEKSVDFLNELLGYIVFAANGDINQIKTRICDLLFLISRSAVDSGVSPEETVRLNTDFFEKIHTLYTIDDICLLINETLELYMNAISRFMDIKYVDMIHKATQYISRNYMSKITIDDVARHVKLSSVYFGRVFKDEMGCSFKNYINKIRVEKSKELLLNDMKLSDISNMVGYEEQSYFTKVFKKITGVSPNAYRKMGGRSIAGYDVSPDDTGYAEVAVNKANDHKLLSDIAATLPKGNTTEVSELVKSAIEEGIPAPDILSSLLEGMNIIGKRFKNCEVFVPDVLIVARAMKTSVELLRPHFNDPSNGVTGKVCIGTVEGDLHDIGKNLVMLMLDCKGIEVIDLGVDVPVERFINTAKNEDCQIILCSALLTTTVSCLRDIVNAATEAGIRNKVKIMIGGAPVTQAFCDEIGADCYTPDAQDAADAAVSLLTGR